MRKWIFTILLFCIMLITETDKVYAAAIFRYSISESGGNDSFLLNYYFEYSGFELSSTKDIKIAVDKNYEYYYIYLDPSEAKIKSGDSGSGNIIYYFLGTVEVPVYYEDFSKVILTYYYISGGVVDNYTLVGIKGSSIPTVTPDPTPTNTPTPKPTSTPTPKPTSTPTAKPTSTPTPKPTSTPTPKPTSTPTPKPTSTPTPKPTSTPTPSPTPEPELYLNAYVNNQMQAVAEYKTGGCTPVKSEIALYEVPDMYSLSGSLLERKVFLSGTGTMTEDIVEGLLYRYKLTYTFVRDGVQYSEYIWSDVLQYEDKDWESGYIATGKISTFRELMYFIWHDLFSLNLRVEDKFVFSIKAFYLWILIAGGLVVLIYRIFF